MNLFAIISGLGDGVPELGATGTVGGLVVYLMYRVSKMDTRLARIEGKLFGIGDTEEVAKKGRPHYRLPLLCVFALLLTGCNVTSFKHDTTGTQSFASWNLFQTTKLEKFSVLQKTNNYSFRSGGSQTATDSDALERFFGSLRKLAETP